MAIDQANKQKWNDTVEKLRQQLNLSDEEVITIKEWGVALLVTGVSVWILYRLVRRIFGLNKKAVEIKVETAPAIAKQQPKRTKTKAKNRKSASRRPSLTSSPWFPLIRKYAGPLLIALAKRQVDRYLRANHIIQ